MSDKNVNNPESTPVKGQIDDKAGEVSEDISGLSQYDKLTDEQLDEIVKGKPASVPEPVTPAPEGTKEPEVKPVTEPTDELPDNIKGKSAEELAKDYINLRKKLDEVGIEVGELRKYKKENAQIDEEIKQYGIDTTAQHLVEKNIAKMTDEQKTQFYDKFSENPAEALMPLIREAIKPITVKQARTDNEVEINRLIDKTKEGFVPYDRKKINKIIAGFTKENGRNELFDKHGQGAFEAAYDIYYKQNIGSALEASQKEFKEKALKEAEEAASGKVNTFTEPQGPSSASVGGNTDYEHMPMAELEKLVGKPKD